jgi:hypothetical protein
VIGGAAGRFAGTTSQLWRNRTGEKSREPTRLEKIIFRASLLAFIHEQSIKVDLHSSGRAHVGERCTAESSDSELDISEGLEIG